MRIVFDLDGTLIDSAPDLRAAANAVLAAEECAALSLPETIRFIGAGAGAFVARMRAARGLAEREQARLEAAFVSALEGRVALSRPYPGAFEALARIGEDHALGLCTNKPLNACRGVLRHFRIEGRFAAIFGGDSLPVRKPDPAPLIETLKALGDGPALYVGDSEVDAETASRAGVPFLLFTGGYRQSPVEALPHIAAFEHWSEAPDLIGRCLAET